MGRDITVTFQDGSSHTYRNAPDGLTPEQVSERAGKEFGKQVTALDGGRGATPASRSSKPSTALDTLKEVGRVADTTIRGGLMALPNLVRHGGNWLEEKLPTPEWAKIPIPEGVVKAYDALTTPNAPQTPVGKAVGNIGSSIVGAMAGPGMLTAPKKLAQIGAAAGVGAEALGNIWEDSPAARMVGGLVGGIGAAGAQSFRSPNTAKVAREAFQGISAQDIQRILATQQRASKQGIDLAPNQALGRASNIDALVSALANSPEGQLTTNLLHNQPAQIQVGAQSLIGRLPGQVRADLDLANRGQEVSTEILKKIKVDARTAWQRIAPDNAQLAPTTMETFDTQLAALADKYRKQPAEGLINEVRGIIKEKPALEGGGPLVGVGGELLNPPTPGPAYMTEALKVKGALDGVLNNYGATKLNTPKLRGVEAKAAQEVRELFKTVIQTDAPDIAAANAAYENVMTTVYNPTKKTFVGELSGRAGALPDVNAPQGKLFSLFEKGTTPGATRSEIRTVAKQLRKEDPELFLDAAQTWLTKKLSTALDSESSRLPADTAGRLTKAFGTPQHETAKTQGLRDVLVGMAESKGLPPETFQALPKFLRYVSMAAERPSSVKGITSTGIDSLAGESIVGSVGQVSLLTPVRQPVIAYVKRLKSNTKKELDQLINTPEGLKMLQQLSRTTPGSERWLKAFDVFMATNAAAQQAGGNPPELLNNNPEE